MVDLKISQFVDGGPIQPTDEIATNRAGVNTKVFAGTAAAKDTGTDIGDVPLIIDDGSGNPVLNIGVSNITSSDNINEIIVTEPTPGTINLDLPQGINTNSSVQFGKIGIGTAPITQYSARIAGNLAGATAAVGVSSEPTFQSAVTATGYGFLTNISTQATAYTLTNLVHYGANVGTIGSGSTVTNQMGFYATVGMVGATNNYGFRGALASSTGVYNCFMDGTALNYFLGRILSGVVSTGLATDSQLQVNVGGASVGAITTNTGATAQRKHWKLAVSDTEVAAICTTNTVFNIQTNAINAISIDSSQIVQLANKLSVNVGTSTDTWWRFGGSISDSAAGNSVTGIYSDPSIPNQVTNTAFIYRSRPILAASTTLTTLNHFYAEQQNNGSGATITNVAGFTASANINKGTNNYGFRGLLAAAANTYNLYMDGTAINYLAGNTGLGITPTTTSRLTLAASSTTISSLNMPAGSAPTSPNHGDAWTTSNHAYMRLNGVTCQLDEQALTTVATTSGSSAVFTVDFTTYSSYRLYFNEVSCAAAANLTFDASSDGGGSYGTTTMEIRRIIATSISQVSNIATITAAADVIVGSMDIWQDSTTGNIRFTTNNVTQTTGDLVSWGSGVCVLSTAANRLRLSLSASSFDAGSVSLHPITRR